MCFSGDKPKKQLAQLSQRDRAAGWVSYAKSGRLEQDNILRTLCHTSTRHKEAVNSSQANKQANIKAVLPQQYNYPYP